MAINEGDLVCHKSNPKKVWVVAEEESECLYRCRRVTDDDRSVEYCFWDEELVPVGVLGVLDTLLSVSRDANEDPAFIAEVAELRERYAETLEVDDEPENEVT
jgi:hypothetical protein